MRAHGFKLTNFGSVLTGEDKAHAIRLNEEWDRVRRGLAVQPRAVYPHGSVGDGYQRAMKMRALERQAKRIVWTKEHESRDDWPRAWRWIGPVFGDVDPRTVQPEQLLALRVKVAKKISESEAHRTIKVWRALWKKMAAMDYCSRDADPSLIFANSAPQPRQDIWEYREVLRLVQRAWRLKYRGLAALMAVAWDSMLSPVDTRKLTPGQRARVDDATVFFLDRAKTGKAAAGTLTRWSEAMLAAYLKTLGVELHADAPIFRNRSGSPYTKDTLGDDFRRVRRDLFGKDETRKLSDMRRSGAVEADAGGATVEDLSNKMANTINASARLRKTYTPVNVVSALRVDEARERGRERKPDKSVMDARRKVSRAKGDAR